jgi:hypothetical protein
LEHFLWEKVCFFSIWPLEALEPRMAERLRWAGKMLPVFSRWLSTDSILVMLYWLVIGCGWLWFMFVDDYINQHQPTTGADLVMVLRDPLFDPPLQVRQRGSSRSFWPQKKPW